MTEEAGSVETGNPAESTSAPSNETSVNTTPTEAPTQTAPASTWIDQVTDPTTKAWAEAKGLQNGNFENVLGSYHNLEKLMGADKAGRTITLLNDDASPEEHAEFYNKLGRPEDASQYSVTLPEGVEDDTRLTMMRTKAHELGLTDEQFKGLAEADAEYVNSTIQQQQDTTAISAAEAEAQLKKEWGAAYDLKVAGINLAAQKLGITEDQLKGLHNSMGPVDAMKFVDGLNTKIGDHDFDSGESVIPNHKTPEQAKIELSELSMNKEFMGAWLDKMHPGHAAAVEKKAALARLVSGVV
tara:strand:+ start:2929 stop:3822 length:894 start_codon:yes stop_codon:yes gene_type:complete